MPKKKKLKFKVGQEVVVSNLLGAVTHVDENKVWVRAVVAVEGNRLVGDLVCCEGELKHAKQK